MESSVIGIGDKFRLSFDHRSPRNGIIYKVLNIDPTHSVTIGDKYQLETHYFVKYQHPYVDMVCREWLSISISDMVGLLESGCVVRMDIPIKQIPKLKI